MENVTANGQLTPNRWSVARFSANASKAKQATSRAKQIDKIQLADVKASSRVNPFIRFEQEKKLFRNALVLENDDLPDNWNEEPAPLQTAEIGDQWLSSYSSLALAIPSVIVPREQNYVLNTKHPGYPKLIKTAKKHEISFDTRLL